MTTFEAKTLSVTIAADPSTVCAFLADPDNLPRWAPAFAPEVAHGPEGLRINRGGQTIELRIASDTGTGVVDYETRQAEGAWSRVYSRVFANGDRSEYVFTLFRFAGMPAEMFAGMALGMEGELAELKRLVEAG